jgi:hypothetical protein
MQKIRYFIVSLISYVRHLQMSRPLMTGRLWHALYQPKRGHPVIRWAQHSQRFVLTRNDIIRLLVILILPLAIYASFLTGRSFPVMLIGLLALTPALMMIFNGTVFGIFWSMTISQAIAHEYQGRHFELVAMTPHSTFEVSWFLAIGTLYRTDRFKQTFRTLSGVVALLLLAVTFFLILSLTDFIGMDTDFERYTNTIKVLNAVGVIAVITGFWLDQIQSILLSIFIAVLKPTFTK